MTRPEDRSLPLLARPSIDAQEELEPGAGGVSPSRGRIRPRV